MIYAAECWEAFAAYDSGTQSAGHSTAAAEEIQPEMTLELRHRTGGKAAHLPDYNGEGQARSSLKMEPQRGVKTFLCPPVLTRSSPLQNY